MLAVPLPDEVTGLGGCLGITARLAEPVKAASEEFSSTSEDGKAETLLGPSGANRSYMSYAQ